MKAMHRQAMPIASGAGHKLTAPVVSMEQKLN